MAEDEPTDYNEGAELEENKEEEEDEENTYDQEPICEEEEEEDIDDLYSKLHSSSEDPEQKQLYREYVHLTIEIEGQNKIIQQLKDNILALCAKTCKTACDEKNIRDMRCCMEKENLKLQCLIQKAIHLQNFGSKRRWREIPITTTFDEDNMKPYVSCSSPKKYAKPVDPCAKPCPDESPMTSKHSPTAFPSSSEDEGTEHIRKILKELKKIKVASPADKQLVGELVQKLTKILPAGQPKKKSSPQKPPCDSSSDDEESQHVKKILKTLKKLKVTCPKDKQMVCEIAQALTRKIPPGPSKPSARKTDESCGQSDALLKHLKKKISKMVAAVEKINGELSKRQRKAKKSYDDHDEHDCQADDDVLLERGAKSNSKNAQIEKLKDNYCSLLKEYARKDAELKNLESKIEKDQGSSHRDPKPPAQDENETELCLLRARVDGMKEEQTEFKCIMKEQSVQLEDYRNKYLSAQQKVEEQCVLLEKLNMNNKRIEKQINCEVKEIRSKFQEKLTELLHFPKLLENEQIKVAELSKVRDDLENKLGLLCKELTAMKENQKPTETNKDLGPELAMCQNENEQLQKRLYELENERHVFCEQLHNTQDELDTLRCESAKIIARTKERTELIRQQQQECINKLERELAQCRATACLSVSDREEVIREMQGQLNTLAFSFDAAQNQIKTLRNHIAYVSNENCYPVKCK